MKLFSKSRTKPNIGMVVHTREGKSYNLGRQRTKGFLAKPISKFTQNLRISYYRWDRLKHLEGKEREEFKNQIKLIKESL